jgi:NADPH:quinone reductase-like Zn-dependent oxidoreductase
LINGAGGGVGTIAIQLAKACGARVTGVDTTSKLDGMRALGADQVLDYTREDFTRRGERYDRIVDIPGNHTLAACRRALTAGGIYVLIGHDKYGAGMHRWVGLLPRMVTLMALSLVVRPLRGMRWSRLAKADALERVRALLASGQLTPPIDRTYPLHEVPAAIRYLQEGRATGKVVITVGGTDTVAQATAATVQETWSHDVARPAT